MPRHRNLLLAASPLFLVVLAAVVLRLNLPSPEFSEPDSGLRRTVRPTIEPEMRAKIQDVVRRYVQAIGRRDFEAALRAGSPEFQSQWTTARFREMIRQGFAPLLAAREVEFEDLRAARDQARVDAVVRDGAKRGFPFTFYLIRRGDRWYVESAVSLSMAEGGPLPAMGGFIAGSDR